jgi:hypothetical protein
LIRFERLSKPKSRIAASKSFGFGAKEFHQAGDGMGSCVVVVRAENGRIAVAYNEDGFSSLDNISLNRNGFIVSINKDESCRARYDRTALLFGIRNHPSDGPDFYDDLVIADNCNVNEASRSELGRAYGEEADGALFGQRNFRVSDYDFLHTIHPLLVLDNFAD